jgi:hypothetical protein
MIREEGSLVARSIGGGGGKVGGRLLAVCIRGQYLDDDCAFKNGSFYVLQINPFNFATY